jgi:RNA polymerase sigma-70 factor (ECF subfamily)
VNCVVAAWGAHEAELRGFLTRQLGDPAVAEDLLQETFVRALAAGSKFCSLDNPRAWLYRVARSRMIDHTRQSRTRAPAAILPEELPADVEEIPAVERLDVCLPRALAALPPADREAIERCDLAGLPQPQFAREQGLSIPGAKSRVQRARKRLKAELVRRCQVNLDESGHICCLMPRTGEAHPG